MQKNIQLQVPKPCHESWANMTEIEKGRFCLSCRKEVIDFSLMSDQQILEQISKASAGFCGRFNNEQLNRDIKESRKPKLNWYKYFVHVTIPALLLSNKLASQNNRITGDTIVCTPIKDTSQRLIGKVAVDEINQNEAFIIDGTVLDEQGIPLVGVTISIKGSQRGTVSDAGGKFKFFLKKNSLNAALIASYVGYEQKEVKLSSSKSPNLKIVLKASTSMGLGEVVVVGYAITKKCKKQTMLDQIKDTINNLCYRDVVKVYPNPIHFGSDLKIGFDVKEIGEYNILISNISGQPLLQKKIMLTSKNHIELIALTGNFSSGIYFVTVENSSSKKTYTNKILID